MSKLQTIVIPAFNRSEALNKQFMWLVKAIKAFESDCEIFVSDNCSTDNTHDIVQYWHWQNNLLNINIIMRQIVI
jgi:abequosyltransferase